MSEDVFSTIDHKALYDKSAQYIKRALKMKKEKDIDGYILFAAFSLELLAKASLAKVSKFLIVDHKNTESLLVASGIKSKINSKGEEVDIEADEIRTVIAAEVYKKIATIIPEFTNDNKNICQSMAKVRNMEIHSGVSISKSLSDHWEGSYFTVCSVILRNYGCDLSQWNREATGQHISSIVSATIDRLDKAKEKADSSIINAEKEIQKISNAELEKRLQKSKKFNRGKYQESWPLDCPVCSNPAHAAGNETFHSVMNFMIALQQGNPTSNIKREFFPSKFYCHVCRLRLDSEEEISATNKFKTQIIP